VMDSAGCDLSALSMGRTYWMTDAQNQALGETGKMPADGQAVFDAKVMNCTFSFMFYALCAWDGARLAAPNELLFAWQAGEGRKFPWGSAPNDATLSPWAYAHDYPPGYPGHWADVPEPGRYPAGNGKFGHADLAGAFLHITNQVTGSKVT